MDTLIMRIRLRGYLSAVFLVLVVFCGCQQRAPDPATPTVTIDNLQMAYAKEVSRQHKYAAFIKQAEKERLPGVANLYRAVARSEAIHAAGHASLLRNHGVAPAPPGRDSVIVGTSLQTLKMAISAERIEVESMYPNLLQTATLEQYPAAVEHFKKTRDADLRHLELLQEALDKRGRMKIVQYLVCSQCGYIVTSRTIATCPICSAQRDSFEAI